MEKETELMMWIGTSMHLDYSCLRNRPRHVHRKRVPLGLWSMKCVGQEGAAAQLNTGNFGVRAPPTITPAIVPLVELLETAPEPSASIVEELFPSLQGLQLPEWRGTFIKLCASKRSVTACAKKRAGVDVITRVCADIEQEGLEMDTKLYNDVINAYCRADDPDKALQYMGLMQACDLVPDVRSYSSLIETLVVARRVDDAEAAYAEMRSKSYKINLRTLNALLTAYTLKSLLWS